MVRYAVILLMLMLGSLSGCVVASEDVEADDRGFFAGRFRLSVPLTGGGNEEVISPAGAAFEIEVEGGSGDFDQRLNAGEVLRLDDGHFSGPTNIDGEFDLWQVRVGARGQFSLNDQVRLEPFGGLSVHYIDLELEAPGVRDDTIVRSFGPGLGLALVIAPIEIVEIYASGEISIEAADDYLVGSAGAEIGFAVRPVRQLSVFAGWRWLELQAEEDFSHSLIVPGFTVDHADLEFDLSGPVFGLELTF